MPDDYSQHAVYYDSWATGVPGDVEFYVDQARQAGSPPASLSSQIWSSQ